MEKLPIRIIIFRVLFLQKIYGIPITAMEKQLVEDLIFFHFVGLLLTDSVLNDSTICQYRKHLSEFRLIVLLSTKSISKFPNKIISSKKAVPV